MTAGSFDGAHIYADNGGYTVTISVMSADGRTDSAAMKVIVNNVPLPKGVGASREGKALGRLCELLYEYGP